MNSGLNGSLIVRAPVLLRHVISVSVAATVTATFAACTGRSDTVTPATVTTAQFQQLRWLEGNWIGSGGGIDDFYEGYHWVDDSTILKYEFPDSSFAAARDTSRIRLREGVVRSGANSHSWVAVSIDSMQATFAPERSVTNGFEWRRAGPSAWTARLTWDSSGVPRERTYNMRAR